MNKMKEAKSFLSEHGFITVRDLQVHFELNSGHDCIMWLKSQYKSLQAIHVRNPRTKTWFKLWYLPRKKKVVDGYIKDKGLELA